MVAFHELFTTVQSFQTGGPVAGTRKSVDIGVVFCNVDRNHAGGFAVSDVIRTVPRTVTSPCNPVFADNGNGEETYM